MALDFLILRLATVRNRKVLIVARHLKCSAAEALGLVVTVWAWAHSQTHDGTLPGSTLADIDDAAGRKGVAEAMKLESVGWLVEVEGGLVLPEWSRHNGQTAKARAMAALRVERHRSCNAKSLQDRYSGNEKSLQNQKCTVTKALPPKQVLEQVLEPSSSKHGSGNAAPPETPTAAAESGGESTDCQGILTSLRLNRKRVFDARAVVQIAANVRCTPERVRWAVREFDARNAVTKGGIDNPAAYVRALIEGDTGPPLKPPNTS